MAAQVSNIIEPVLDHGRALKAETPCNDLRQKRQLVRAPINQGKKQNPTRTFSGRPMGFNISGRNMPELPISMY